MAPSSQRSSVTTRTGTRAPTGSAGRPTRPLIEAAAAAEAAWMRDLLEDRVVVWSRLDAEFAERTLFSARLGALDWLGYAITQGGNTPRNLATVRRVFKQERRST